MENFAVTVMPVVDTEAWKQFVKEATVGDRAEAHQQFLRRGGVTREHIFRQSTPDGDVMLLVWEGVDQAGQAAHIGSVVEDPQSDHERYLRDHVVPVIHGIDVSQPPPPPAERIA